VIVTRGVRVGARSHVGSMSLVLRDVPDEVLAYGIPAKVVRRLEQS
jgi:acetyltransferase-like isoleucine patch superfamily enzyme